MFGKEKLTNLFLQLRTCPPSPRPETGDIRQRPCVIAVSHMSLFTTHKKKKWLEKCNTHCPHLLLTHQQVRLTAKAKGQDGSLKKKNKTSFAKKQSSFFKVTFRRKP